MENGIMTSILTSGVYVCVCNYVSRKGGVGKEEDGRIYYVELIYIPILFSTRAPLS